MACHLVQHRCFHHLSCGVASVPGAGGQSPSAAVQLADSPHLLALLWQSSALAELGSGPTSHAGFAQLYVSAWEHPSRGR